MDIHGIFYVSKAQMIEKLPSDDESEPMETQAAATTVDTDKNNADAQNGVTDTVQVHYLFAVYYFMYSIYNH